MCEILQKVTRFSQNTNIYNLKKKKNENFVLIRKKNVVLINQQYFKFGKSYFFQKFRNSLFELRIKNSKVTFA